jgi:hypothetical protein
MILLETWLLSLLPNSSDFLVSLQCRRSFRSTKRRHHVSEPSPNLLQQAATERAHSLKNFRANVDAASDRNPRQPSIFKRLSATIRIPAL